MTCDECSWAPYFLHVLACSNSESDSSAQTAPRGHLAVACRVDSPRISHAGFGFVRGHGTGLFMFRCGDAETVTLELQVSGTTSRFWAAKSKRYTRTGGCFEEKRLPIPIYHSPLKPPASNSTLTAFAIQRHPVLSPAHADAACVSPFPVCVEFICNNLDRSARGA